MATGYNLAERLEHRRDWSESHRQPPPVPIPIPIPSHDDLQNYSLDLSNSRPSTAAGPNTAARTARSFSISVHHRPPPPPTSADLDAADAGRTFSLRSVRPRGNSFSFLRRSPSAVSVKDGPPRDAPPPVPALPNTLISQAHSSSARGASNYHAQSDGSSTATRSPSLPSSSPPPPPPRFATMMLRKSSRQKQKEEPPKQSLPPPHLPTLQPLPNIAAFDLDDARPDSVAIFNHAHSASVHSQSQSPSQPRTNFSRPHHMASALATSTGSSPPGYVARPGGTSNASSSSPSANLPYRPAVSGGEYVVDPYDDHHHKRVESMAHRGRFSYASSHVNAGSNSPRRVRRRKDPTPFNVLVVGAKNSGKSSFVSFLRHSLELASTAKTSSSDARPDSQHGSFTSHYLETEMSGERVGLTLWDSSGLEKAILDLQLRELTTFVESKFEDTFVEEQKVMRSPGVKDTHIHCVLLLLDPVHLDATIAPSPAFKKNGDFKGSLHDGLDVQVMQALWGKTTVIPVIGKADTLTLGHMAFLKRAVWESLKSARLDPLEALELEDTVSDGEEDGHSSLSSDDSGNENILNFSSSDSVSDLPSASKPVRSSHHRQSSHPADLTSTTDTPYLPMSVLSPDPYDLPPFAPRAHNSLSSKHRIIGRRFAWGVADPNNASHCDFGRLRDSVFLEWRSELRELSRTRWYENWRTTRLNSRPMISGGAKKVRSVLPRDGTRVGSAQAGDVNGGAAAAKRAGDGVPRSVSNLSSVATVEGGGGGLGPNGNGGNRIVSGGSEKGSMRQF